MMRSSARCLILAAVAGTFTAPLRAQAPAARVALVLDQPSARFDPLVEATRKEIQGFFRPGELSARLKVTGWSLDVVPQWQFANNWTAFGRVGYSRSETEGRFSGSGAFEVMETSADRHQDSWNAGLGVGYAFGRNLVVRGEWTFYSDLGHRDLGGRFDANAVFVSAHAGDGLDRLRQRMGELVEPNDTVVDVTIPYERGDLVAKLHAEGRIDATEHGADGTRIKARVPVSLAASLGGFATF